MPLDPVETLRLRPRRVRRQSEAPRIEQRLNVQRGAALTSGQPPSRCHPQLAHHKPRCHPQRVRHTTPHRCHPLRVRHNAPLSVLLPGQQLRRRRARMSMCRPDLRASRHPTMPNASTAWPTLESHGSILARSRKAASRRQVVMPAPGEAAPYPLRAVRQSLTPLPPLNMATRDSFRLLFLPTRLRPCPPPLCALQTSSARTQPRRCSHLVLSLLALMLQVEVSPLPLLALIHRLRFARRVVESRRPSSHSGRPRDRWRVQRRPS